MSHSWFQNLEKELDEKLADFLQANRYQNSLLIQQDKEDLYQTLKLKQQKLQEKAEGKRKALLALANDVDQWTGRATHAKKAGAKSLACRADDHVKKLMNKGRAIWKELDGIGKEFKEAQKLILDLTKQSEIPRPNLEQEWAKFETEEELDQLKRRSGLNN